MEKTIHVKFNKKCKKGIEYKLDFYNKYITRTGATIKKVKYDYEFIDWLKNESQVRIPIDQDIINICRECMKNYDKRNQNKKFYMFIFIYIIFFYDKKRKTIRKK